MDKLLIHPLPNSLVLLLQEKHRLNGRLGPKGALAWNDLMPSLLQTHFKLRALASHPRLDEIAIQVGETLDRMQKTLQDASRSQEFTADCFKVYALMDEYVKTRAQLNLTRLPNVDVLIHAIQAHLKGNLHPQALEGYAARARLDIDELVLLYKNTSENFEEPIRQAFLKGIDSFATAYQQIKAGDPESLKNATVNLKNGATLLEHLAKWRDDFERAESSPVPVVGEFVQGMLKELKKHGKLRPETLHLWTEERFWDLQEHWAKSRHDLFMPRPQKDGIVGRLDSLMVNLRDLDRMAPRAQEQLLMNLEAQFEALSGLGFDLNHLKKHPNAWLVDLFVAILAEGVPLFKIQEMIDEFRDTDHHDYAILLERFLTEKDRDYLLDGLANMQKECDELTGRCASAQP
jgi:hypothetical protein